MVYKNFIILGGNGMLGHMISLYLLEMKKNVICILRSEATYKINYMIDDFQDFLTLKGKIDYIKPDVVINTVGVLVDESNSNPAEAIRINSLLPQFLERHYSDSNIKIVQISTDCVFRGDKGQYSDSSIPDSVDLYGITKTLGEISHSNKDLTLRTSIIGPNLSYKNKGLFDWFYFNTNKIKGYNSVYWTGLTTLQLAKIILQAIELELTGLINVSNNNPISKYKLLKLLDKFFFCSTKSISIDNTVKIDKSLISNLHPGIIFVPGYEEMIEDMKLWIIKHQNIYSKYRV